MGMNFDLARFNMVAQQVRTWDVIDERVLKAMDEVKREDFVPQKHRKLAFADVALPLGEGQHMLKPVVEGRMLQALGLNGGERVLQIGTGSGFTAACMAALGATVVSLERSAALAERARGKLQQAGAQRVSVLNVDGLHYTPTERFDVVAVMGSVFDQPERFVPWLKSGGRAFVVCGRSPAMEALLMTRVDVDRHQRESLFEIDIEPLIGGEEPRRFAL
jgi:protein-L-isoaspartate(D-aspartate) O-methyltransferase